MRAPRVTTFQGSLSKTARISLFVIFGLFIFFDFAAPFNGSIRATIGNVGLILANLVVTVLCYRASRIGESRRDRLSWLSFCIYSAATTVVKGYLFYVENFSQVDATATAVINTCFMLAHIPTIVSLILIVPRDRSTYDRFISIIDALVLTVGFSSLTWNYSATSSLGFANYPFEILLDYGSSAIDQLMIFAMLSIVMAWSLERVSLSHILILSNVILTEIVTALYRAFIAQGRYDLPPYFIGSYMFCFGLLTVAALVYMGQAKSVKRSKLNSWSLDLSTTKPARMLLPYASLPAIGIPFFNALSQPAELMPIAVALSMLIVLIMVRQFVMFNHTARLAKTQHNLNQIARKLSLCRTVQDVLATGLREACTTTGAQAGLIWMPSENGQLKVAFTVGLTSQEQTYFETSTHLLNPISTNVNSYQVQSIPKQGLDSDQQARRKYARLVTAPLVARRTTLGSISLLTKHSNKYGEDEPLLVKAVAAQIGITLDNIRHLEEVTGLADKDGLTGLLNHRASHERLRQEISRAQRAGQSLSVLILDIDKFKFFNDTYGHLAGDQVIKLVANVLKTSLRECDIAGRYGGDEFIAVITNTNEEEAKIVAARIRNQVASSPYITEEGLVMPVRTSIGVACFPDDARQIEQLVAHADADMYETKHHYGKTITDTSAAAPSQLFLQQFR